MIVSIVACSTTASAQRCGATCSSAETMLGVSEQTLVATIPELRRLSRPVIGPRNSRGKWELPDIVFATQPYKITYFIGVGVVNRIELLSTASREQCMQKLPFDAALVELAKTYGESQVVGTSADGGQAMHSIAFNTHAVDVSLHFSSSDVACSTRIIYKTREVKDASEL